MKTLFTKTKVALSGNKEKSEKTKNKSKVTFATNPKSKSLISSAPLFIYFFFPFFSHKNRSWFPQLYTFNQTHTKPQLKTFIDDISSW